MLASSHAAVSYSMLSNVLLVPPHVYGRTRAGGGFFFSGQSVPRDNVSGTATAFRRSHFGAPDRDFFGQRGDGARARLLV